MPRMPEFWDLFILLFFSLGSLLYGLSLGRSRANAILVSIYSSLAVVTNVPILNTIPNLLHFNAQGFWNVGVFLALVFLIFFLLSRSAAFFSGGGAWWRAILMGMAQAGLLISVTLMLLPTPMSQGLTEMTKQVFMSDQGRSIWLVLPLILMILAPSAGSMYEI